MRRWASIAAAALALFSRPSLAATGLEDGLKAELSADKLVLEAGRSAALTVEISWPGKAEEFIFEAPVIPAPDDFRIERAGQSSATFLLGEESRQVRRFNFSLQADKAIQGEIGPATVAFRRAGEEKEERLSTQSLSFKALPSWRRPFPTGRFAAIAAVALAVIAAGAIYLKFAGRRSKQQSLGAIPPPLREPEEEAREGVNRIRHLQMEGEIESGREELRKTVLNYLRTKYCLQIEAGLTIQEAVQKAAETLPEEVFPLVRNFLSELEAGRFGDGKNDNLSKLLRDAERLISNPKEAR